MCTVFSMSLEESIAMSNDHVAGAEGYFLKLIAKEDFNGVKPDSPERFSSLDLEHFSLQTLGGENVASMSTILFESDQRYVEGHFEGTGIQCSGDHQNENDSAELRIVLKPEKVHRLRFALDVFATQNVSHIEFYEPSGNVLKRFENKLGWIDYQVPLLDKEIASIARVSIYYRVYFGTPYIDSFELWRWQSFE